MLPSVTEVGGTLSFPKQTLMCRLFFSLSHLFTMAFVMTGYAYLVYWIFLDNPQPLLKRSPHTTYFWSLANLPWHSGSRNIWLICLKLCSQVPGKCVSGFAACTCPSTPHKSCPVPAVLPSSAPGEVFREGHCSSTNRLHFKNFWCCCLIGWHSESFRNQLVSLVKGDCGTSQFCSPIKTR